MLLGIKILTGTTTLLGVMLFAAPLLAQTIPDPVQYIVAPEAPGPNQQVYIEAQGVGSFLGNATITWSRDGVVVAQGPGQNTFTFTTGGAGQSTTVRVTINSPTQGVITKTFTFNPAVVHLLWEADTTVPLFYKGKAHYSAGSPLKVVAIPTVYAGNSRIAASALSYQWFRNDEPVQNASGIGRTSFSFVGDMLQSAEVVRADVYYGSTKVASEELVVPATDPLILLYQKDALRGSIYDQALPQGVSLIGSEVTIQAEPLFFSRMGMQNGTLAYTWQLNGEPITGPDAGRGILTLRQTGSGSGSAVLSVAMQNYDNNAFIQAANTALQIIFGQGQTSVLSNFGL